MPFPKLKYPRLCRILTYVVVLGCGLLPIAVVFPLNLPDLVKIAVLLGSLVGLLVYLFHNFMTLMMMDMALASLSCYRTARTQYTLPSDRTPEAIRHSVLRYGTACEPSPIQPQPRALRYRFSSPMTTYSRGIERVVAAYETDLLDVDTYRGIFRSAKANSQALTGRKKPLFLDHIQKKQPLHRVTVILILAHRVDPQMVTNLYHLVCKQCGNEEEDCLVPCVVDLEQGTCVFNCLRVPYIGFSYAVKNRGIRLVKRLVFGGNWNLRENGHTLKSVQGMNPEDTLWNFWRALHHQFVGADREAKKMFASLAQREIRIEDDCLYLKWDERGICQITQPDPRAKTVKIEAITNWAHPKSQPVGKKLIQSMQAHICAYYARQGYRVEFADLEALDIK